MINKSVILAMCILFILTTSGSLLALSYPDQPTGSCKDRRPGVCDGSNDMSIQDDFIDMGDRRGRREFTLPAPESTGFFASLIIWPVNVVATAISAPFCLLMLDLDCVWEGLKGSVEYFPLVRLYVSVSNSFVTSGLRNERDSLRSEIRTIDQLLEDHRRAADREMNEAVSPEEKERIEHQARQEEDILRTKKFEYQEKVTEVEKKMRDYSIPINE